MITQTVSPSDVYLSAATIASAKRRAEAAVVRMRHLEDEARDVAARSTEVTEANHLTEHLASLMAAR